jgi:hypothetical protein
MESPSCTQEHILWWYINNGIRTFMKAVCSAWNTVDLKILRCGCLETYEYTYNVLFLLTLEDYTLVRTPVQSLRARISLTRLRDLAVHNYRKFHYPIYGTRTVITKLWRFKFKTKSCYCCTVGSLLGYSSSVVRDCPDFLDFIKFCPDVQQKSAYDARCLGIVLPNHKNKTSLTLHTNIF